MKILCHVAPWCIEQFRTIAFSFSSSAKVRLVSGFRKLDETGLIDAYYQYVGHERVSAENDLRDDEVILRCRLLRSLPTVEAKYHVSAMRRAMREMLLREKPDVILCESVDQYLHDLLFQEAKELGVVSYGLIRTFVNGYFRISERGEMQRLRKPDEDEVETVLHKLIDQEYLPKNLVSLKRNLTLTYLRIYASNHVRVIYFFFLRILSNEFFNYHYWASTRTTRKVYTHLVPKLTLGDPDWRKRISTSSKPVIFIPLQHFPEATIDYWAEDCEMVDYLKQLTELIQSLGDDFQILLKEHPGVWGFRHPKFYKMLGQSSASIIWCPTKVRAQECIDICNAVLVWTGSIGFEAALRGKPVLATCTPYYASGKRFKKVSLQTSNYEIVNFIKDTNNIPVSFHEQYELVRHFLSGSIPGVMQNDGTFNLSNPIDVENAKKVGEWLRFIYDDRTA